MIDRSLVTSEGRFEMRKMLQVPPYATNFEDHTFVIVIVQSYLKLFYFVVFSHAWSMTETIGSSFRFWIWPGIHWGYFWRSDFCRSTIVYDIVFFVDIRRVAVLFVIDLFEDMIFSRTGGTSTNRWLYHTLPDIHLFRKKQKRFSKTKSYGNDWNRHCMWLVMFVAATNPAAFELLLSEMFGAGIQTVSTYREG